jgi:hypothetical protein
MRDHYGRVVEVPVQTFRVRASLYCACLAEPSCAQEVMKPSLVNRLIHLTLSLRADGAPTAIVNATGVHACAMPNHSCAYHGILPQRLARAHSRLRHAEVLRRREAAARPRGAATHAPARRCIGRERQHMELQPLDSAVGVASRGCCTRLMRGLLGRLPLMRSELARMSAG